MRKTPTQDLLKYIAGFALAAALLWWVFRDTDWASLLHQIKTASVLGLLAAAILNLSQNVFRVWRWRALLAPVRPAIAFRPLFAAVILGYLVSWVMPGRLGEILRPALLSGREGIPLAPCLGSVVADRVLDAVTILALFALGAWITPLQGPAAEHAEWIRWTAFGVVAVLAVVLGVLVAIAGGRPKLAAWFEARGGLTRWLGRTVLSLSEGVDALRRPRLLLAVVIHSFCVWGVISLALWIGARACGAAVPFGGMLMMMPLIALGVAVPTPGGFGGFHAAIAFGLAELFGVDPTVAKGAGVLLHLIVFVPILILGPALIVADRVPLNDLVRAARQIKELGAERSAAGEATP